MLKTHLLESAYVIRKAREQVVRCEELHRDIRDVTDSVSVEIFTLDSLMPRADTGLFKLDPYR